MITLYTQICLFASPAINNNAVKNLYDFMNEKYTNLSIRLLKNIYLTTAH